MSVGMTMTGRLGRNKTGPTRKAIVGSAAAVDVRHASRVGELKKLVAAGRYEVEPQKLALTILVRALRN
jgi:anti-sigma28 factor (negative regulator of flagellin synthesis)